MSKELGLVVYRQEAVETAYSQETARKIDEEMRSILDAGYQAVKKLLTENRDKLDMLAGALMEKETLYAGEIYQLLGIKSREEHLFH